MTDLNAFDDRETPRVIGGVDTHKDVHVGAVLDELGRLCATASFPASVPGYRQLTRWLCGFGEVIAVGVEGTESWGAGLSRHLRARGLNVIEVNRTNRQTRRRKGKLTRLMPKPQPVPCSRETRRSFPKRPTARSNRCGSYGSPGPAR